MNSSAQSNLSPFTSIAAATRLVLGLMLAAGTALSVHAQGEIASGTVSGSGSGPYNYSLTFADANTATSPIGSIWYSWVPGFFYLPALPTSASAPPGWTATISANSIQFVASSVAYDIIPGNSRSGFHYQATFSPAQLAAAQDSGVSVAYSGALLSDNGNTFTVSFVPEPSAQMLLVSGLNALWLVCQRKRRTA